MNEIEGIVEAKKRKGLEGRDGDEEVSVKSFVFFGSNGNCALQHHAVQQSTQRRTTAVSTVQDSTASKLCTEQRLIARYVAAVQRSTLQ